MWHVSISRGSRDAQRLKALQLLAGVGNRAAGEWFEDGEIATHLRRGLSVDEAAIVGSVTDVRGTEDAWRRYRAMTPYLTNEATRAFAERECER